MYENLESITDYLDQTKDIPLLTLEEETKLSAIIQERLAILDKILDEKERQKAEEKDKILTNAISDLTVPNLRLVLKESLDLHKKTKVSLKDLIGHGNLGLIKSAYKYNAQKYNTKFSTYATYWIRMEMYRYINSCHIVTIPFNVLDLRYKYNKMVGNDDSMSDLEIIQELEINENKLQKAKDANVSSIYLSQVVSGEDSNNTLTIGDLIVDEGEDPSDAFEKQDDYTFLMTALERLDPISREIVCSQLLEPDKITLSDLGKKYNLSAEGVRLIKNKALKTLKSIIKKELK